MPTPGGVPESILSRVLESDSPRPLRLAAARGALPLSRQELALALVKLIADSDPEVASTSAHTLQSMAPDSVAAILGDPHTDPEVLDHFARKEQTPSDLLSLIVINPSASDETLEELAASTHSELLDRLVANESRLVGSRGVVEKLKNNPALSRDARRRLAELEQHLLGGTETVPSAGFQTPHRPEAGATTPPLVPEAPETATDAEQEALAPVLEVPLSLEEQAAEQALRDTALFQRLVRMSVAEKIQAALKGNSEERSLLIRSPVRVVATTVLKSPKLNENEIESYAKLRTVDVEVLRTIGTNRDWAKNYGVAHALVHNPRTPIGIALTMVKRLNTRDLKSLGLDRNVPEVIRRTAKRMFEQRTMPVERKLKKK